MHWNEGAFRKGQSTDHTENRSVWRKTHSGHHIKAAAERWVGRGEAWGEGDGTEGWTRGLKALAEAFSTQHTEVVTAKERTQRTTRPYC